RRFSLRAILERLLPVEAHERERIGGCSARAREGGRREKHAREGSPGQCRHRTRSNPRALRYSLQHNGISTRAGALMAKTVAVGEVIGSQRFGPFQVTIVALCGMIQFLDGFDTQALAYAAPALREAWNLKPQDLGPVFTLGAFGTGLGSVLL